MATVSSSKEKRVPQDRPSPNNHRPSAGVTVANVVRGGLMGLAETVPGVSGGTVALVTGIYSRLIASAKHLTDVPRAVVLRSDWRAQIRQVDWWLLIPVAIGMLIAVFSIAGVMETFVTEQPVYSKALFMGMIAASVAIPFLEVRPGDLDGGGAKGRAAAVFAMMAVAVFVLTSLPRSEIADPPLVLVCAAKSSNTHLVIEQGSSFAVNVLARGQEALSNKFASKKDEWTRFDGVDVDTGSTGTPLLRGTVGAFDCRVVAAHDAGDHVIYVGQVEWLRIDTEAEPLLHQSGRYGAFSAL